MRKLSLLLALAGTVLLIASFLPLPEGALSMVGGPAGPALSPSPTPDLVAQGAALFRAKGCVACHRQEAVDVGAGGIGPDLSHYQADPAFLRRWLRDPAAVRPGTRMPNLGLEPAEIEALIAFLNSDGGTPPTAPPASSPVSLRTAAAAAPITSAQANATPPPAPDPHLATLVELSEQARLLAREEVPDPVLRQVITDLQATSFLFTDEAATVEVDVVVPRPGAPPGEWQVDVLSMGKLLGHRGADLALENLKIGPQQVARAMEQKWPDCTVRSMSLIRDEGSLQWVGFCNTPQGVVSGAMDNDSGVFRPSQAPPARPPAVATAAGVESRPDAAGAKTLPARLRRLMCPVTQAPDPPFVPPQPYPRRPPGGDEFWYGSEALWTMIPRDGRWDQLAHGEKVWWWRAGYDGSEEPRPELRVTARRLDGVAPVPESGPPATNGYDRNFRWAMLTGFMVPTPGCWEITGHYQERALTFVVWVAPLE